MLITALLSYLQAILFFTKCFPLPLELRKNEISQETTGNGNANISKNIYIAESFYTVRRFFVLWQKYNQEKKHFFLIYALLGVT